MSQKKNACRYCGCTEERACKVYDGVPCWWIEKPKAGAPGLCSNPKCLLKAIEAREQAA